MESNRRLIDCMIVNDRWRQATFETLINETDLQAQVERYGEYLAFLVTLGQIGIEELRAGVTWANALDKEVVDLQKAGVDLGREERVEATARRIAHHAGRFALGQVKTVRRRLIQQVKNSRQLVDFGAQRQGM